METTNHNVPQATLCHIVKGDPAGSAAPGLGPFLEELLARSIPLHLGFVRAPVSRRYLLGQLCPVGTALARSILPGGVERLSLTTTGGVPVHAWVASAGLAEEALRTLLLTDVAVTTDRILWLDDCRLMVAGWWEALDGLWAKEVDYLGQPGWMDYSPKDIDRMQSRPWYRGVALERRDGRPGVSFMDGFWGLRAACLKEIDGGGERNWCRWACEQPGGWPVLLGEMARQLNWTRADQ